MQRKLNFFQSKNEIAVYAPSAIDLKMIISYVSLGINKTVKHLFIQFLCSCPATKVEMIQGHFI